MPIYDITFSIVGGVQIEAPTIEAARKQAAAMPIHEAMSEAGFSIDNTRPLLDFADITDVQPTEDEDEVNAARGWDRVDTSVT